MAQHWDDGMTAVVAEGRYTRLTLACGEPAGGGTPAAVVDVCVDHQYRRTDVLVVCAEHGGLGATRDHSPERGSYTREVTAGDQAWNLDYAGAAGEGLVAGCVDLLERHFGVGERYYRWRQVTAESPWWDGRRFVRPS
jgi:hypothetical protein